jgi:predicted membrane GTPase involved in stress response
MADVFGACEQVECGATDKSKERAMDHNQLEKERGITILSKATAVDYRDGYVINIVDTPGRLRHTHQLYTA